MTACWRRISDWSSDVCTSDLLHRRPAEGPDRGDEFVWPRRQGPGGGDAEARDAGAAVSAVMAKAGIARIDARFAALKAEDRAALGIFVSSGDPDFETGLAIRKGMTGADAGMGSEERRGGTACVRKCISGWT